MTDDLTLREAARLMREDAERADAPGEDRWYTREELESDDNRLIARTDAAHIASWHPAVALAVADWLDAEAGATWGAQHPRGLAVARAYLGDAA